MGYINYWLREPPEDEGSHLTPMAEYRHLKKMIMNIMPMMISPISSMRMS